MNHFTDRIPAVLIMAALSSAAVADNAARAAAPTATAQATSTRAASPAPKAMPAKATAVATSQASGGSDPSVRRLVCLNMSLQCFALEQKPAQNATKPPASALDIQAPDIRRIVSEEELRQRLEEPAEIEESQAQVQVEGTRPEVYVPGGIASLPWAVMHPTQAWRILLPVPPGTAK